MRNEGEMLLTDQSKPRVCIVVISEISDLLERCHFIDSHLLCMLGNGTADQNDKAIKQCSQSNRSVPLSEFISMSLGPLVKAETLPQSGANDSSKRVVRATQTSLATSLRSPFGSGVRVNATPQ